MDKKADRFLKTVVDEEPGAPHSSVGHVFLVSWEDVELPGAK